MSTIIIRFTLKHNIKYTFLLNLTYYTAILNLIDGSGLYSDIVKSSTL